MSPEMQIIKHLILYFIKKIILMDELGKAEESKADVFRYMDKLWPSLLLN